MTWYLEALGDERGAWRTEITPVPFRIGRQDSCHLRLSSASISGQHALIDYGPLETLVIEDLGSTNGTFVNLHRVDGRARLSNGDVIHFADQEYRVCGEEPANVRSTAAVNPDVIRAMRSAAERRKALEEFIRDRRFQALFQPIVDLKYGRTMGYEALGRAVAADFFRSVDELFTEAKRLSLSLELSEALRFVSAGEIQNLPLDLSVFINTHPFELHDQPRLLKSIDEFLESVGSRKVVIEIHEMAITDVPQFLDLRNELERRGVALAFDDFGRGQSRFLELAALKPQYVKFDRAAIEGASDGGESRASMIGTLVDLVHKMGQMAIAEGIETQAELDFCRELGFDYGQGYLLGRPRPSDESPTVGGVDLVR